MDEIRYFNRVLWAADPFIQEKDLQKATAHLLKMLTYSLSFSTQYQKLFFPQILLIMCWIEQW